MPKKTTARKKTAATPARKKKAAAKVPASTRRKKTDASETAVLECGGKQNHTECAALSEMELAPASLDGAQPSPTGEKESHEVCSHCESGGKPHALPSAAPATLIIETSIAETVISESPSIPTTPITPSPSSTAPETLISETTIAETIVTEDAIIEVIETETVIVEAASPALPEPLMRTERLVKKYGGRAVVNGVDVNVGRGEIVGLLGPNGAGKTTTFYMIVGLVLPASGRVFFDGADITSMPMYRRARQGMGYLPQEESIFRKLTVEQNIMAILETQPLTKTQRRSRCDELLTQFGITHVARNLALTLSGGEKRRLTIARSLVPNPTLLMLDEPFSGVDPIAVEDIQGIITDLRSQGLAILITDHNVRETLNIVDRAYLIFEGKVIREGSKEFLTTDEIARRLYLGENFQM